MGTNKAVIYARVSSIGDRQSTDRQVKDLTDYAVYQNIHFIFVFYRLLAHYICLFRRKSLSLHIIFKVQINTKLTMEDLLLTVLFFIALRALLKGFFGGKSTYTPDK